MMLRWIPVLLLSLVLHGCATAEKNSRVAERKFTFQEDTFAFANELFWEYQMDPATGQMTSRDRQPPPQYALHCFVLSRSARQFFRHARFDASKAGVSDQTYRYLIRKVVGRSPRRSATAEERIVIPGFSNLREFSRAHERLLKAESGGAWQSYFQRGHWRMLFPFPRSHQERMAAQLVRALDRNDVPVVHVVRFPRLTINHAMLLFGFAESGDGIEFLAYDPNYPEKPALLRYERRTRTFTLPFNSYFAGGRVDVYEVYHAINY
jgi:hypothetical protein